LSIVDFRKNVSGSLDELKDKKGGLWLSLKKELRGEWFFK
jgi:hypothetical protein